jgi:hypothetical protein
MLSRINRADIKKEILLFRILGIALVLFLIQAYSPAYAHNAYGKIEGDVAHLSNGLLTVTYDCSNQNSPELSVSYLNKVITKNSKFNVLYKQGPTEVTEFKTRVKASLINISSFADKIGEGVELSVNLTDGVLEVMHQVRLYSDINMYSLKAVLKSKKDLDIISNVAVYETSYPYGSTSISPFGGFLSFFEGDNIWYPARTIDISKESTSSAKSPVLLIEADSKFSMSVFSLTSEHNDVIVESYNWGLFKVGYEVPSGASLPANLSYDMHDWIYFAFGDIDTVLKIYTYGIKSLNTPSREKTVSNPFVGRGVCDWYNFYGDINEQNVKRWLDIISQKLKPLYNFYILDDGWENATRRITWSLDWRQYNDKRFPNGISSIANYAHQKGTKLILWVRPTILQASEDNLSPVISNNPSLVAWRNGEEAFLNVTSEDFKNYLNSCFSTWKSWGVDGLKVDFIAVDVGGMTYNNPHLWFKWSTRTEALNSYLDALDELASKYNLPILLCGTPNNFPSIRRYPNLLASRVSQDSEFNGKYNRMQVNTILKRSFLWGSALNVPDPDAFSSRDRVTVTTAILSGGVVYLGDDLETSDKELAFLRFFKVDSPAIPLTSDWTREFVLLACANMTITGCRYLVVAAYNWEPTDKKLDISFSDIGLKSEDVYHVFETWSGEYLGKEISNVEVQLKPLSVGVFVFAEDDTRPKVFVATPATELKRVSYHPDEVRIEVDAYLGYSSSLIIYSPKVPTEVIVDGAPLNKVQDPSYLKVTGQDSWYYDPLKSVIQMKFTHVNAKSNVRVILGVVYVGTTKELREHLEPWLPILFLIGLASAILAAVLWRPR